MNCVTKYTTKFDTYSIRREVNLLLHNIVFQLKEKSILKALYKSE